MRLWVLLFELLLGHAGYSQDFELVGMPSRTVPVSGTKMTNLVFPEALETGVKVSRDVLVQRPRGVDNVIQLKAVRRNFPATNLSVFGKDGRLYTFDLRYVADTDVLSFRVVASVPAGGSVMLTGLPVDVSTLAVDGALLGNRKGPSGGRASRDGLRLQLSGVFLRHELLWLCFKVENHSGISFTPAFVRVFEEDKKKVKRTATQDLELAPVYASKLGDVQGRQTVLFTEAFRPFTVGKGKRLVVQLADDTGGRSLELVVKRKVLLGAKEVPGHG